MVFVYILVDPRVLVGPPKPFYIGYGYGNRPLAHFNKHSAAFVTNTLKCKVIRDMLKNGVNPIDCFYIDERHDDYGPCMERERNLIKRYGTIYKIRGIDKGILTNKHYE